MGRLEAAGQLSRLFQEFWETREANPFSESDDRKGKVNRIKIKAHKHCGI